MSRKFVATILALCDCLALVAYILNASPIIGQGAALALKLLLVPFIMRSDSIAYAQRYNLLLMTILCLISVIFSAELYSESLVRIVVFLLTLSITLMIRVDDVRRYCAVIAVTVSAAAVIYIVMLAMGMIPRVWGRLFYFHGLHPNLGAEISAMGVVCGALSLRYWPFALTAIPSLALAAFVQGRAAILTIVLAIAFRSGHELLTAGSRKAKLAAVLISPLALAVAIGSIPYVINSLRLDDTNRGLGTGLGGRAGRWELAFNAFIDRPLTGQGLGFFDEATDSTPHNFFLYGIAEMGLLFVPIVALMLWMAYRAYVIHGSKMGVLATLLVMMMMNDRFINLNLYPFVAWVLLFALSATPAGARADRRLFVRRTLVRREGQAYAGLTG